VPLLIRPRIHPDELSMGYLLRVAEANWLTISQISVSTDIRAGAPTLGICGMGPVCHQRGMSLSDRSGVPNRFWNVQRARYCPHCLSESAHWRGVWGLSLYTACPRHGATLLDHCRCGAAITWRRAALVHCACGADLREQSSTAANPSTLKVASLLANASNQLECGGESQGENLLVAELQRIWLLGAHACGTGSKPKKLAGLQNLERANRVTSAVGDVLLQWPSGFFDLLNSIRSRRPSSVANRLVGTFGALYRDLFSPSTWSAFAELRSTFEQYVQSHWDGQLALRNRRVSAVTVAGHEWVSALTAARELGWRTPQVRRAIEAGLLVGHIRRLSSGRTVSVVARSSLAGLKREREGWIDVKTACSRFHVGKKRVLALVKSNHLRPIRGPNVDGSRVWQFRAEDVRHALLAR
jgi:hypothetical protein